MLNKLWLNAKFICLECCHGPGYRTPLEAMRNGPREKLIYAVAVQPNLQEPHGDYLATIDVDPESPTYSQVNKKLLRKNNRTISNL